MLLPLTLSLGIVGFIPPEGDAFSGSSSATTSLIEDRLLSSEILVVALGFMPAGVCRISTVWLPGMEGKSYVNYSSERQEKNRRSHHQALPRLRLLPAPWEQSTHGSSRLHVD